MLLEPAVSRSLQRLEFCLWRFPSQNMYLLYCEDCCSDANTFTFGLLGYDTWLPTFRRNVMPSFSGYKWIICVATFILKLYACACNTVTMVARSAFIRLHPTFMIHSRYWIPRTGNYLSNLSYHFQRNVISFTRQVILYDLGLESEKIKDQKNKKDVTSNFLLSSYITRTAAGIRTKMRCKTLYLSSLRCNKVYCFVTEIKIIYTQEF
jgi:hypothetical protein